MNPRKSFSFKEAYKFSANSTIDHFGTLLKYSFIWIGLAIATGLLLVVAGAALCFPVIKGLTSFSTTMFPSFFNACYTSIGIPLLSLLGLATLALSSFLFTVVEFQLLRFAKAYYAGNSLTLTELFTLKDTVFLKFWAARVLFYLKIIAGLILLIIPGIYIIYTYCFSGYSLFDGTTDSIGEDARMSADLTHSVKWRIFFAVLLPSLFFAGSRGLYLLVASPIAVFMLFSIYKQLRAYNNQQA